MSYRTTFESEHFYHTKPIPDTDRMGEYCNEIEIELIDDTFSLWDNYANCERYFDQFPANEMIKITKLVRELQEDRGDRRSHSRN